MMIKASLLKTKKDALASFFVRNYKLITTSADSKS